MLRKIIAIMALALAPSMALAQTVNVNKADAQQIAETLTGVGPTIAQRIVEERDKNGRFKDHEDLRNRVQGVGRATIEKNRERITFDD